jgi:hypothetical protein
LSQQVFPKGLPQHHWHVFELFPSSLKIKYITPRFEKFPFRKIYKTYQWYCAYYTIVKKNNMVQHIYQTLPPWIPRTFCGCSSSFCLYHMWEIDTTRTTKSNLQRQRAGQNFSSSIIFRFRGSVIHLYVSAVFVTRSSCHRTNIFKSLLPLGTLMKRMNLLEFVEITQQTRYFFGLIPVSVPLVGQWRHSKFRRRWSLDRSEQHSGVFLHWCCSISCLMYLVMVNMNAYYICVNYLHAERSQENV